MAFGKAERLIAWRYLRARRQEGFVSVIAAFSFLGIVLGVATLIIVMAVMNGFKVELMKQILGFNGEMTVYAARGPLEHPQTVRQQLEQLPEVARAQPLIEGQGVILAKGQALGIKIHGLMPEDLQRHPLLSQKIKQGALDSFGHTSGSVVLGARLANKLRLRVGDAVTFMAPQGHRTAFGMMPRHYRGQVVAIFEVGMIDYDQSFAFIPLLEAQRFFNYGSAVTGIELFLRPGGEVKTLTQALRQRIYAGEMGPLRTVDWEQANATFFHAVEVERNVMFIILTLIILIATFNIISNLIMLVKDKSRDIGILRTMGATRSMIMRIFFLTGASIGVSGTAGGFIVGYGFASHIETIRRWLEGFAGGDLFSAEIYFLSKLPAVVRPFDVALVVSLSLLLSFLATLYPSWRAARLDPIEALHHGQ